MNDETGEFGFLEKLPGDDTSIMRSQMGGMPGRICAPWETDFQTRCTRQFTHVMRHAGHEVGHLMRGNGDINRESLRVYG